MKGFYNLANRKKGVSPVIAVVLLIALTVAAAAVIWAITQGLIGGGSASIQYNVTDVSNTSLTVYTVDVKFTVSADATLQSGDLLGSTTDTLSFSDTAFTANNEKSVTITITFSAPTAMSGSYKLDLTFNIDGNTKIQTVPFSI